MIQSKEKKQIIKIIGAIFFVLVSFCFNKNTIYNKSLFVLAYILVGYDVAYKAIKNLCRGKVFDENFLMTIATIGAFGIGELEEAVAVMLFYQIGELFQNYAVNKSRKSITELMDIRPDYANIIREDKIEKVNPEEVHVGDIILVKPGEKIPLDGMVVEGESDLDTKALTGEAIPKKVKEKDDVLSGCLNNTGILKIKVAKVFEESTVSKILDLVENASNRKSKSENFISKFAKYYTPIVVIIALLLAIIPPFLLKDATFSNWLYRSLSFLVVSCPCALVISIPLSFFGGIGAASKIGVLIKGSNYLEALAKTEIVVCDKTGTLTKGVFEVQKVEAIDYSKEELLKYAALAETFSNHPISISLKQAYGQVINEKSVTKTEEISGKGIFAKVEDKEVLIGNEKLMEQYHIQFQKSKDIGTLLYLAINSKFAGTIVIADEIKQDAYQAIKLLRKNGIKKIVMLTGDRENISTFIKEKLELDEVKAELLPQDKVFYVEKLMQQKSSHGKLLFVGDGINDAPVLAMSDIGISMGALGSDAAIEASDVVIMTDEPSKIAKAIQISRKTMKIVQENITFAIVIKIGILILSALGYANMWLAVFADVGVSVLAILNAIRILHIKFDTEKRLDIERNA